MIKFLRYLWLILIVMLVTYIGLALFKQNKLQLNVLDLLPVAKDNNVQATNLFIQDADLSNSVLFVFGHKDFAVACDAVQKFKMEVIREKLPVTLKEENDFIAEYTVLFKDMHKYRAGLLSESDRKHLKKNNANILLNRALTEVTSPIGVLGSPQFVSDPFYLFPKFIVSLKSDLSLRESVDGINWQFVKGNVQNSIFSLHLQKKFADQLELILTKIKSEFGVEVLKTGALFYTMAGAKQANNEISNISIISIVGIIVVLLLMFGTINSLGIVVAIITTGIVCGIAASLLVFNSVHILALVFGCSLVGVCIDYAIHYYCASYNNSSKSILSELMPSLPLGVVSSCLGYGLLVFVPFPGIQQMAVLTAAGLVGSFISVVLWGPCLVQRQKVKLPKIGLFIQTKLLILAKTGTKTKLVSSLVILIIVVFVGSLFYIKFSDDIRGLQSLNLDLKSQEDQIRSVINFESSTKFLQIEADSIENLLKTEEKIIQDLQQLIVDGVLNGYRALASLQPSMQRQLDNRKLLQEQLYPLYGQLFTKSLNIDLKYSWDSLGFSSPLLTHIELPTGWRELVHYNSDGRVFGRILLSNISDPAKLIKLSQNYLGVKYVDQPKAYSELFLHYRQIISMLILVVLFMFILILSVILGFLAALKIVLPVSLTIMIVVALLSICGVPINLFNTMGLLLVLCLGIDYALFSYKNNSKMNLLANALSAVTTILSFGLLCFSNTVAVSSFGLTIFLGILVCFVLTTILIGKNL